MADIVWSLTARRRLRQIHDYIARDSPDHADTFVAEVSAAVERLARFPNSGRLVPEAADRGIREIVFRDYRIAYRVLTSTVVIVTIWHGAMDVGQRLDR